MSARLARSILLALAPALAAHAGGIDLALKPCPPAAGVDAIPRVSKTLVIPRAKTAPKIDGQLDDACWAQAALGDNFLQLGSDAPAKQQTTARVCYDDRALYLGFVCLEAKMPELLATRTKHDGGIWQDDCVEIFIDPAHDHVHYCQFIVNALGTRSDLRWTGKGLDAKWGGPWEAKATRHADRWVAEVAIPFDTLDARPGVWGMNFTREEQPHAELSCWAKQVNGFAARRSEIARFADAAFDCVPVQIADIDLGREGWGDNAAALKIENLRATPARLQLTTEVVSPSGQTSTCQPKTLDVPAKATAQAELPYRIGSLEPGAWQVRVWAHDAASSQRWALGSFPVDVDAAAGFTLQSRILVTPKHMLRGRVRLCMSERAQARFQAVLANADGKAIAIREQPLTPDLCSTAGATFDIDVGDVPLGHYQLTLRAILPDGSTLVESTHPFVRILGPFDSEAAQATRNPVANASFESVGKDGAPVNWHGRWWAPSGSTAARLEGKDFVAVDEQVKHDGQRSVRIRSPRTGSTSEALILTLTKPFPIQPGVRYKLRCWWRGEAVIGAAKIWLQTSKRQSVFRKILDKSQADWQRFEGVFVPEAGETSCRINVTLYNGRGTLWVDAIEFAEDDKPYGIQRILPPNVFKPQGVVLLDREVEDKGLTLHVTATGADGLEAKRLAPIAATKQATRFALPKLPAGRSQIAAMLALADGRVVDSKAVASFGDDSQARP